MGEYFVQLASEEQRGSTKPNIVHLNFASDADAILFGQNLGGGVPLTLCSAINQGVTVVVSKNYALPYPAGTERSVRCAFGNAAGYRFNMAVANTPALFVPDTRVAAIQAAGIQMVGKYNAITGLPSYGNAQVFDLQPSI